MCIFLQIICEITVYFPGRWSLKIKCGALRVLEKSFKNGCEFMLDFDREGSFLFFLELLYMSGWEKTTQYQVRNMQEHVERTDRDFWHSMMPLYLGHWSSWLLDLHSPLSLLLCCLCLICLFYNKEALTVAFSLPCLEIRSRNVWFQKISIPHHGGNFT